MEGRKLAAMDNCSIDTPALKRLRSAPTEVDVEQVSLPMRIALLAVLAFAGLWFVALRPKPPETAPAPPAAEAPATASGITGAPKKAETAVDKASAVTAGRAAEADARTGGSRKRASTPARTAPAAEKTPASKDAATPARAATPAKPAPRSGLDRVLADLDAKRTVVLLFWNGRNADDREVRAAVDGADRHGGRVRVHVATIADVGAYEPITRGVPIVNSPTVVVIGRDRTARTIDGLTVRSEVDELVDRALAR